MITDVTGQSNAVRFATRCGSVSGIALRETVEFETGDIVEAVIVSLHSFRLQTFRWRQNIREAKLLRESLYLISANFIVREPAMIRFEIHDAVACAILFLWHPIHASDEGPSAQALSKSGQKAELKHVNIEENGEAEPVALKAMRKIAAGCNFLIKAEEAKRAFGLRKEPLLKYADDQIAVAASTLWVWMDGEIPAFFQKIEVNN